MATFSTRDQIVEVVNKLFVYTDEQEWEKLQQQVFTKHVLFDNRSMGGEKMHTSAIQICEIWKNGFEGIDSINHLAGNYLIELNDDEDQASVFAYATATHFKKSAVNGKTRSFVGTYNIHLVMEGNAWKISEFKYNLKYATGNVEFN
jgi:hypothetical protein